MQQGTSPVGTFKAGLTGTFFVPFLAPNVLGTYKLTYDLRDVPAALAGWADLIPGASRRATFTAWVGRQADGRPAASVGFVWTGAPEEGRRLLTTLRGLGPAIDEQVREMTYLELQSVDDVPSGFGRRQYAKGHYLPRFGDAEIDEAHGVDRLHFQHLKGGRITV